MKSRNFYVFLLVLAISTHVGAVFLENDLLIHGSQFIFLFPLLGYFYENLPSRKSNFYGFLICVILADLFAFSGRSWYFDQISLGFWMISFVFLVKEAVQYTEYTKGSRFMLLYFLLVVSVYIYLFSLHVMEIEENLADGVLFSLYVIYYMNLLVLGVTALIYYLNSFSKKSVFFISLALAFILADVLRDMQVFYFKDVSVEIAGGLIKFSALIFAFLFFVTKEKKLRLLNLV